MTTPVPFRRTLPIANLVACLLFVVLREATPAWHLQEIERARQLGGVVIYDSVWGTLACRTLYSWSTFHGGEDIGVAALEVLNLPSLVLTVIGSVIGEGSGLARLTSACGWSWLLAGVFIVTASAQWWLVGTGFDRFICGRFSLSRR
jgi:hypothetical protein